MNKQLSICEHILTIGDSQMENRAAQMIREIKEIKSNSKLTYDDIMVQMEKINSSTVVSLSTLRRVFRDGSESKASSFNFEEILTPIYNAVKDLEGKPSPSSPFEIELQGFKNVIRVQNEELDRLIELKEHLDDRVDFLVGQVKTKDEMIQNLMKKLDEKDAMIQRLMDKCL